MAKQREISEVSDAILMEFMKEMRANTKDQTDNVGRIQESVSALSNEVVRIEGKLDGHLKNEETVKSVKDDHDKKRTAYIAIIVLLAGVIVSGLTYIWQKEDKNEKVHQRTEQSH